MLYKCYLHQLTFLTFDFLIAACRSQQEILLVITVSPRCPKGGPNWSFCSLPIAYINMIHVHSFIRILEVNWGFMCRHYYSWLSEAKPQSCHENRDLRYIYVYIVRETRPQAPVITLLTSAIF